MIRYQLSNLWCFRHINLLQVGTISKKSRLTFCLCARLYTLAVKPTQQIIRFKNIPPKCLKVSGLDVHIFNCRSANLWGETHNPMVTVVFSLDGQKGMQLWQFVQRKRNAVIWDNAPRNPILMPRHTLQFAFSGFRFGTSLSDVDGNNKSRPSSCRHACSTTHAKKPKQTCFFVVVVVCLSPQLYNNTKANTFHQVN